MVWVKIHEKILGSKQCKTKGLNRIKQNDLKMIDGFILNYYLPIFI